MKKLVRSDLRSAWKEKQTRSKVGFDTLAASPYLAQAFDSTFMHFKISGMHELEALSFAQNLAA